MIVGLSSCSFNIDTRVKEIKHSFEASDYIAEHYDSLLKYIKTLPGINGDDKAKDLLHDVYISVHKAEMDGEGYDSEYYNKKGQEGTVLLEQFIYGRIKQYAKNDKYRSDLVSSGSVSYTKVVCIETPLTTRTGYKYDKNGNIITEKNYVREKCKVKACEIAASFNDGGDVEDNNDSFQKAYAMASTHDSLDDLMELYSLREQIDYCIDICSLHNINLLNILKNMDKLASLLSVSSRKKTADNVFEDLHKLVSYHTELAESLMSVLKFSMTNRSEFDAVLATY